MGFTELTYTQSPRSLYFALVYHPPEEEFVTSPMRSMLIPKLVAANPAVIMTEQPLPTTLFFQPQDTSSPTSPRLVCTFSPIDSLHRRSGQSKLASIGGDDE